MYTDSFSRYTFNLSVRYVIGLAILAGLYAVTGYAGITVSYFESHISLIWPPTGIAAATMFRFGYRYWPGVLVGALIVEASVLPVWVAVGIAVGNTLGPMLAVWLLRWIRFQPAIESQADVVRLIVAGALLPMLVSATNGMAWICSAEFAPWARYWEGWWVWWLGDAVGVLIFATPILSFTTNTSATFRSRVGALQWVGIFVVTLVMSLACLGSFGDSASYSFRLELVPPLVALWATLRYGLWVGSTCLWVIAAVAVWDVANGVGPFFHPSVQESLIHLSGYLTALTIILLMLSTVISERDAATRGLMASEELYRTLVEGNPAMICRIDVRGMVTYVNKTYTRLTRQPAEKAIGRPLLEGCAEEDRLRISEALTTLRDGATPVVLVVLAPGGRMRWHKWTIRAADAMGTVTGFEAVGMDVTELRRAEEERRKIEVQMYHTQKLESLGVMAGGIAHDFNNLLTGIIGHAEMAANEEPGVRAHLARVAESAQRAADLTRQLLAYAGKASLVARRLDLADIIRDTTSIVNVSIPKKCTVKVEAGSEEARVNGDEVQLRQVVMNLLINAGEAIGDRHGLIRIRTDVIDLDPSTFTDSLTRSSVVAGRYSRLRVSDTGCGMDETTKTKIFEPFFTTKFTGRGLGLAAVHGIVRSHHGLLQVESEPSQGSEFTVLFPWYPEDTHAMRETPPNVPSPALPSLPATSQLGNSILVIDDEVAVLSVAREMLEHAGWDVRTATNGHDGLRLFHHDPDRYRVVVVDLTMHDLSGMEVLTDLRRIRADVPVILCTGFGAETIPDLTLHAPARPLIKPFLSSDLLSAVATMAGNRETIARRPTVEP